MTLTRCIAFCISNAFGLFFFLAPSMAYAQNVNVGLGSYTLNPKGQDPRPPSAPFRTPELLTKAAPTNQWYSSLIFHEKPEALFAHPFSVKPTDSGIEVALPRQEVVPTERQDVEIHFAHQNPVRVSSPSLNKALISAKLKVKIDSSPLSHTAVLMFTSKSVEEIYESICSPLVKK